MKYFAKSFCGQDQYWIELFDAGMDKYFFDTSLQFDLYSHPKLKKLIRILCDKKIPGETRKMFIKKMFFEIEKIDDVRTYFFKDYQIDKYGQYKDDLKYSWDEIVRELKSGSPYTASSNAEVFYKLKNAFEEIRNSNSVILISMNQFERGFYNNELKNEYVNVYCSKAKYYLLKAMIDEKESEVYFMLNPKEELIFYMRSK